MRAILVFAIVLALGGCASQSYSLTGIQVGNQQVTFKQGTATVRSAWQDSIVTAQPIASDMNGDVGLWISVDNTSDRTANFGTENVEISYDGQSWIPAKSYAQLKSKLDRQAGWHRFAAALVGGLSVAAASQAGHYSERGAILTPYGGAVYAVNGVDRGEQWAAMNAAGAQADALMDHVDAEHDANLNQLNAQAVRTTTIAPGQSYGGLVFATAPDFSSGNAIPVLVRVGFLNDAHVLEFQAHQPGAAQAATPSAAVKQSLAIEARNNIVPPAIPETMPEAMPVQMAASSSYAGQQVSDNTNAAPIQPAFQRFDSWEGSKGSGSAPQ